MLTGAALIRVPSRALSRTLRLLGAVLRSALGLSTLCLGALSRRCLTLSALSRIALSRIALSLGTTLTILRMQRLQTRR